MKTEVGVLTLKDEGISIQELQNTYFKEKFCNEYNKVEGRYIVKCNDMIKHDSLKNDIDIILFKYQYHIIAYGKLKNKECLDNPNHEEYKYYYQFEEDSIKVIPPISEKEILNDKILKCIVWNRYKGAARYKIIDNNQLQTYLNRKYDDILLNNREWKEYKKQISSSLLKEINLYNFENIHTSFLANFLKPDNIYDMKDETMKLFLEMLNAKNNKKKFNHFFYDRNKDILEYINVIPQKRYDDIIPDIIITFSLNGNKYRIILEGKLTAYENIYSDEYSEKEEKQCEKYYNYFEKYNDEKRKNIYVYLSIRKSDVVSDEHYITITFQNLIDFLYSKCFDKKNKEILKEYLKSFHFLTNPAKFYYLKFEDIPNTGIFADGSKIYNSIIDLLNRINELKIVPKLTEEEIIYFRYLLVIIYYSNISLKEKELIKSCYEKVVG